MATGCSCFGQQLPGSSLGWGGWRSAPDPGIPRGGTGRGRETRPLARMQPRDGSSPGVCRLTRGDRPGVVGGTERPVTGRKGGGGFAGLEGVGTRGARGGCGGLCCVDTVSKPRSWPLLQSPASGLGRCPGHRERTCLGCESSSTRLFLKRPLSTGPTSLKPPWQAAAGARAPWAAGWVRGVRRTNAQTLGSPVEGPRARGHLHSHLWQVTAQGMSASCPSSPSRGAWEAGGVQGEEETQGSWWTGWGGAAAAA